MHDSTYRNDIIYLMNLIIIFGLSFIPCSIIVLLGLPYNNNNNTINIKQIITENVYKHNYRNVIRTCRKSSYIQY